MEQKKKRVYRKRIPYGMMNFEDVRKDDCYYVDKTPFIEEIGQQISISFIFALAVSARALPFLCSRITMM